MKIRRRCKCGCGRITNPGNKWVNGHYWKNRNLSGEHRKKISLSKMGNTNTLGYRHLEETKKKISKTKIGTKHSKETKKKQSIAKMGNIYGRGNKNKPKSKAHKKSISLALMGNTNAKGHSWKLAEETRKKMSKPKSKEHRKRLSKPKSKEQKRNMSLASKKLWQDPEFVRKQMKARKAKQNKIEFTLGKILNNLFPNEYKFVGDGELIINGKNPDFVNINGQKKIIELFGNYWHKDDNPQDRIDIFTPFGYKTLIIWENELKKSRLQLRRKLQDFHVS